MRKGEGGRALGVRVCECVTAARKGGFADDDHHHYDGDASEENLFSLLDFFLYFFPLFSLPISKISGDEEALR